ncbi:MAG TPA: AtpZ/AtpI family protein [Terriglobia bacterium]|nr:AtpZ/AtpI family protein [Terriglobia bacterium]
MKAPARKPDRGDLRAAFERDFRRQARREPGHRLFWRSIGVLGSVGWPIAILTAGGALLGHALDVRWNTGVRYALILVTAGAITGSWIAWRSVGGRS